MTQQFEGPEYGSWSKTPHTNAGTRFNINVGNKTFGPYAPGVSPSVVQRDLDAHFGKDKIRVTSTGNTRWHIEFIGLPEVVNDPKLVPFHKVLWRFSKKTIGDLFFVLVLLAILIALATGVVWTFLNFEQDQQRARNEPKVREKLVEACKLLDQEGFDGDPAPCLDEDGKPIK